MKNAISLFAPLIVLSACTSSVATPTSTTSLTTPIVNQASPTASSTETPVPTPTVTEVPMPEALTNLPAEFLAIHNPDGTWGIGIVKNDVVTPVSGFSFDGVNVWIDGNKVEGATIVDSLKVGENGNPIILGELVADSDQEDAMSVAFYYDGTTWKTPEEGHAMTYYPDFDGLQWPAVGTIEWYEYDPSVKATDQLIIGDNNGHNVSGEGATMLGSFGLTNCIVSGHKLEAVVLNPSALGQVSTMRDVISLNYLYGGKNNTLEVEVRDRIVAIRGARSISITLELLQKTYPVGTELSSTMFVFRPNSNTTVDVSSKLRDIQGSPHDFYIGSFGDIPLTMDQIRSVLFSSTQPVVEFPHDEVIVNSLEP
jgi:hypothetical protein